MKLYYAPGACSLSNRISLHEAGLACEFERVDIPTKTTETGADFLALNPRGYVPLLVLDDGQAVTENIAVLSLIADRAPQLLPDIPLGRIRMLEMLSFISTELHVAFKPFFHGSGPGECAKAAEHITHLLDLAAIGISDRYLFGARFTPADAYLFVILLWAMKFGVAVPEPLPGYFERVAARPSVSRALAEEQLIFKGG